MEKTPYQLYLISDLNEKAFQIYGKSTDLRNLFDPEEFSEKVSRIQDEINNNKKLNVRGGYVPIKDLSKEWAVPESQLIPLLNEEILSKEPNFTLEEIRDMKILKRKVR